MQSQTKYLDVLYNAREGHWPKFSGVGEQYKIQYSDLKSQD